MNNLTPGEYNDNRLQNKIRKLSITKEMLTSIILGTCIGLGFSSLITFSGIPKIVNSLFGEVMKTEYWYRQLLPWHKKIFASMLSLMVACRMLVGNELSKYH